MKAPRPRQPARVRFAASARGDLPSYTMEEAEAEVDRLTKETEAQHARSRLDAKAIWAKYNKRR